MTFSRSAVACEILAAEIPFISPSSLEAMLASGWIPPARAPSSSGIRSILGTEEIYRASLRQMGYLREAGRDGAACPETGERDQVLWTLKTRPRNLKRAGRGPRTIRDSSHVHASLRFLCDRELFADDLFLIRKLKKNRGILIARYRGMYSLGTRPEIR